MTTQLEKDLNSIGENYESFIELNRLISIWAEKKGWYIVINRVTKKGWVVYGIDPSLTQIRHEIGLKLLEEYFDSPTTMLNKFISTI